MRRNNLENLVTNGKLDGKNARGRPRDKYMDGVVAWLDTERNTDLIRDNWQARWEEFKGKIRG